jgi:superfamily II DNA or RNA helicase
VANRIERPNKNATETSLTSVLTTLSSLDAIVNNDVALQQSITAETNELRRLAAISEMEKLDVETLNANKSGIRITALRNAGINNIAQLYGMNYSRIRYVNGIGEQSASQIVSIVNQIYQAVVDGIKIRVDIKNKNPHQDRLLSGLYAIRYGKTFCEQARALRFGQPNVEAAINDVRPATSSLRWLFTSRAKKEQAVRAYEYLASLANGQFGFAARDLAVQYDSVIQSSSRLSYQDFENNSAAYYTLLENLGLRESASPAAGMPTELVAAVEKYPLELRHMKTELRDYQVFGAKYVLSQKKTLLGDEMGLGKTIQALTMFADLKARGETHFLVVCPASVLVNWQRETEKHTDLASIVIHGFDKQDEFLQWRDFGGVGITNYESVKKLVSLLSFNFGALVVDEAHFVKNPDAQRTKALLAAALRTERILYMTGTPLENRVDEMCFLIGCLRPDIGKNISTMKTLSATSRFRTELAPAYLRRVRDDVLSELPDLIESEEWLELNLTELQAYRTAVFSDNFMAMRRVSWDVDAPLSSKTQRLIEICDEAKDEGRRVIVFSFFLDTLRKVCAALGSRAVGPITGGVSTAARQQMIDDFSEAEAGAVLVAQVQAGGFGLNIQAASVVIFAEPQIKPSLETQAISRAYRMGQVRDVQVHRLLAVNTIDERMMNLLLVKQNEFDIYAEESVAGIESQKSQSENAWIKAMIEQEQKRLTEGTAS